jgi:glycine dehydrogenase subunit 1
MNISRHPYFPTSPTDVEQMLARCGASKLDDLYADVPAELRLKAPYALPEAMSETELRRYFSELNQKNQRLACFAGAGFYDHYTPSVIPAVLSRSEFYTAYTPYQPEISQGTLQYIFEYQTIMCELTGMDVSNASMYDGATATAEAMLMAVAASRKKNRVLISSTLNPAVAQVVATYAKYHGVALTTLPAEGGITSRAALEKELEAGDVAGVIVASPNYFGIIEDYTGWADTCHQAKALLIMNCVASTLAVLRTPGEWGADIACGDAQSLGMPLNFGGPYLGYLCCKNELMRKLPGRIVGATTDEKGQRVFVLTLQAREQHIRREKATSNICSNQGLMALHTAVYVALMGPVGLREVNAAGAHCAHTLVENLTKTGLMSLKYPAQPYLNEALMQLAPGITADEVISTCAAHGILAGVKVADNLLLVAATETMADADMMHYIKVLLTEVKRP